MKLNFNSIETQLKLRKKYKNFTQKKSHKFEFKQKISSNFFIFRFFWLKKIFLLALGTTGKNSAKKKKKSFYYNQMYSGFPTIGLRDLLRRGEEDSGWSLNNSRDPLDSGWSLKNSRGPLLLRIMNCCCGTEDEGCKGTDLM